MLFPEAKGAYTPETSESVPEKLITGTALSFGWGFCTVPTGV
jgi:hypothetical protein